MSLAVSQIEGRVGGTYGGRDVRATITQSRVEGRIGGTVIGWDVDLKLDSRGNLSGRFGGRVAGRSVARTLGAQRLDVRLGGNVSGADVSLQMEDNRITGRIGGRHLGYSFDLVYNERTKVLTGRIGGRVDGKDVDLQLYREANPLLAALLAGAAVYQLLIERRSRSNNS